MKIFDLSASTKPEKARFSSNSNLNLQILSSNYILHILFSNCILQLLSSKLHSSKSIFNFNRRASFARLFNFKLIKNFLEKVQKLNRRYFGSILKKMSLAR
eukprot:UN05961